MNFLDVLKLSKQISTKDYDKVFSFINNYYKPYTCLHLITKIKEEIFQSNPIYKVTRNIKNKEYNLNLETDNFLNVTYEEDIEINEGCSYKINFPNIISLDIINLNIISIIKKIKINNNWVDIDSYNIDDLKLILDNIDINDFRILKEYFEKYITKIEKFTYIKFNKINENLSFETLLKFVIENFHYDTENLYQILLSLMRHFNFTYSDFKEVEFHDGLRMIKIGNKIVNEENEVNNKNE